MIHLYTGDGKGKTTAAIGLAVRAAGQGMQVYFAQFMKGNDSGELHVLEGVPNVTLLSNRKNFGFYSQMSEADKKEITDMHNEILDKLLAVAQEGRLIVLDEVTYPVMWNLVDETKLKKLLACGAAELVLTGRDAADFLTDAADYITEMKKVRHPYDQGIQARRGIEY